MGTLKEDIEYFEKTARRSLGNLVVTFVCFCFVIAGIYDENLVGTVGFGLLFIGLNRN